MLTKTQKTMPKVTINNNIKEDISKSLTALLTAKLRGVNYTQAQQILSEIERVKKRYTEHLNKCKSQRLKEIDTLIENLQDERQQLEA